MVLLLVVVGCHLPLAMKYPLTGVSSLSEISSFPPPISVFFFCGSVKLLPPDTALFGAFQFLFVVVDHQRHCSAYHSTKEYTKKYYFER
jgi:hypothetical protein